MQALFDPSNAVVRLCAEGMAAEGEGRLDDALHHFQAAWEAATTSLEKSTAAHYLARRQNSVAGKLKWDLTALEHALRTPEAQAKLLLPSLHLNVAKCHEDLEETQHALAHYRQAQAFAAYLPDDGYGRMVRRGIEAGIERLGA